MKRHIPSGIILVLLVAGPFGSSSVIPVDQITNVQIGDTFSFQYYTFDYLHRNASVEYNPSNTNSNISAGTPIQIEVDNILIDENDSAFFNLPAVMFNMTETVGGSPSETFTVIDIWAFFLLYGLIIDLSLDVSYENPFPSLIDTNVTGTELNDYYDIFSSFNMLMEYGTPIYASTNTTFYDGFEADFSELTEINTNRTDTNDVISGIDTLTVQNNTFMFIETDTVNKTLDLNYGTDFEVNGTIGGGLLDVLLHMNVKFQVNIDYAKGILNSLNFSMAYVDTIGTYFSESQYSFELIKLGLPVTTTTTSETTPTIPSTPTTTPPTATGSTGSTDQSSTTGSVDATDTSTGSTSSDTSTSTSSTSSQSTPITSTEESSNTGSEKTQSSSSTIGDVSFNNFFYSAVILCVAIPFGRRKLNNI
ncbi:MAG: hypothetical protein ACW98K_15295 [Candidatus Kariarchaeaceae archaeon]